jgi:hypothetical protein
MGWDQAAVTRTEPNRTAGGVEGESDVVSR